MYIILGEGKRARRSSRPVCRKADSGPQRSQWSLRGADRQMLIGFRSAASVVDQQRKSKHKKHKVPSRKIKRFQPEGRVHGVWIRSHQKGGGSALTVHTLSSLRGGGGGCVVDHDVVCVCMDTVVNGTWQLAVHSRTFLGSPVTTTS